MSLRKDVILHDMQYKGPHSICTTTQHTVVAPFPEQLPKTLPSRGIQSVDPQCLRIAPLCSLAGHLTLGSPEFSKVVVHIHLPTNYIFKTLTVSIIKSSIR